MPTPQGSIRVCEHNQVITIQVIGWGTMKQSLPVRRFAEQGLSRGVKILRVDLAQCTYLDSTFLGTLLTLQRTARRMGGRELVLVCPSSGCTRLFKQLGVQDAFPSVGPDPSDQGEWTELPIERDDPTEFNRHVVQAHQELANLGGTPAEVFGGVARRLTDEWNSGSNN
jgi:anti-anti-sigma regulatory factor